MAQCDGTFVITWAGHEPNFEPLRCDLEAGHEEHHECTHSVHASGFNWKWPRKTEVSGQWLITSTRG